MATRKEDFESIRQIYTVLVLHFVDGMKQAEIATAMNLSPPKLNRVLVQGQRLGMRKVAVQSACKSLVDLEKRLVEASSVDGAVVAPTVPGSTVTSIQYVGPAAANQL